MDEPQTLDREELRRLFDLRSSYNALHGWRLHRRSVSDLARAPRAARRCTRARARADRLHRTTPSSMGCRSPTGRTSRRSASTPATPRTATPRCSRRHPTLRAPTPTTSASRSSMLSMGGDASPPVPRARATVVRAREGAVVDLELDRAHGEPAHRRIRRRRSRRAQRRLRGGDPGAHDHRQLRRAGRAGTDHPESLHEPPKRSSRCSSRSSRPGASDAAATTSSACSSKPSTPTTTASTHRLSDAEIYSFALLLLAAGSGTTWKQMGITITALLQRPDVLDAVREDRQLLRSAIEESLRWMPTDPMFSRWVTRDIDFHGVHLPEGAVLHLCIGAANRDPARWERPEEYDIHRGPEADARVRERSARVPRHARRTRGDGRRHQRAARPTPQPATRPRRRTAELHRHVRTRRHCDPGGVRMTGNEPGLHSHPT